MENMNSKHGYYINTIGIALVTSRRVSQSFENYRIDAKGTFHTE
jgi:hypothetical protein